MAKGKALRTLRGDYGKVKAGEEFELPKRKLQSLVDKGVAEFVDDTDDDDAEETTEKVNITEKVPKKEKATITVRKEKDNQAGPAAVETKPEEPIIG